MFDTISMSDAGRFLLAVGGGLLFSLACVAAALGPASGHCTCAATTALLDRPTLL